MGHAKAMDEKRKKIISAMIDLTCDTRIKPTENQVRNTEIMKLYLLEGKTSTEIAELYKISSTSVLDIINSRISFFRKVKYQMLNYLQNEEVLSEFRISMTRSAFKSLNISGPLKNKLISKNIYSIDQLLEIGYKGLISEKEMTIDSAKKIRTALKNIGIQTF